MEALRRKWDLPDTLGAASITALEQKARQQGNYHRPVTAAAAYAITAKPDESHAVVFLDVQSPGEVISLKAIANGLMFRPADAPPAGHRLEHHSLFARQVLDPGHSQRGHHGRGW